MKTILEVVRFLFGDSVGFVCMLDNKYLLTNIHNLELLTTVLKHFDYSVNIIKYSNGNADLEIVKNV
jgi:hypothetical protein